MQQPQYASKTTDGVRLEIEPLFPKSSSMKMTIEGTGKSKHIREFTAKIAFITPPYHYVEENCTVIAIPNGSRLIKADVGFDYENPDEPDPFNLWVVAELAFWCKTSEPLLCLRIVCVKAINQEVMETTLTRPDDMTSH